MQCLLYSAKPYEKDSFNSIPSRSEVEISFIADSLNVQTAELATGYKAICCFVTDRIDAVVLEQLKKIGVEFIALRSAGFNHIDLLAAKRLGLRVARVASYSPYSVAEHAVALILALSRKLILANSQVNQGNFLLDNLLGFDVHSKTVGIIGLGKIGAAFAKIMSGFGCALLAYDLVKNQGCASLGIEYVDLNYLYNNSDIISLHCPLNSDTQYLINATAIQQMKANVMIINTSRGSIIDTNAVLQAMQNSKIGFLGLDVYEYEQNLFFQDHSHDVIQDKLFTQLRDMPNVLLTAHQAFFTREAITNIAKCTINNLLCFFKNDLGSSNNTLV